MVYEPKLARKILEKFQLNRKKKTTLHKALLRNYWTVREAASFLREWSYTPPPDTENTENAYQAAFHAISAINDRGEAMQDVLTLWRDTDHIQAPRDPDENVEYLDREYRVYYFIEWAKTKKIPIPWLNWAISEGLLREDIAAASLIKHQTVKKALHPKKERTYLLIIAALLHEQGIDWRSCNANSDIRKHIDSIGKNLGVDAMSAVLKDLTTDDETMSFLAESLRNKV